MTLVEMIVVLAIVAIIAGAAALGLGALSRAPSVEAEARRFADRLQYAVDETMMGGEERALVWDETSYGFVLRDGRAWRPETGERLARHRLPGGMTLDAKGASPPALLGGDGIGMPFAVRVNSAGGSWLVIYDGLNATAIPARPS